MALVGLACCPAWAMLATGLVHEQACSLGIAVTTRDRHSRSGIDVLLQSCTQPGTAVRAGCSCSFNRYNPIVNRLTRLRASRQPHERTSFPAGSLSVLEELV
jgi:hypothetical protein